MKRAVGGATRSPLPGTTLDLIPFGLPKGFKVIDTPGIPSQNQARRCKIWGLWFMVNSVGFLVWSLYLGHRVWRGSGVS